MVKTAMLALSLMLAAGPATAGGYGNYLMHASPSKDLESYLINDDVAGSFDAGPVMRGDNDAAIVWLRGRTAPPQSPGINVLGNGYAEIFRDSRKKGIYNTVRGTQAGDAPRPFNAFAGCEEEMGL